MNEIFENNLKTLSIRKPKLADMIRSAGPSTIILEEAKDGSKTFTYDGVYFHSRYDPIKEAERLRTEIEESGWDYTLIFGMGLGFLIRAIQDSGGKKLLIFEPSMDILRGVFESVDLSAILIDKDIFITESLWEVSAIVRAQAQPVDILGMHVSLSYKKFFMDKLAEFTQAITNAQSANRVMMHTFVGSGEDWFINYLLNVPNFFKYPSIDTLKDSFKGRPIIIVGAGPSLEKNARELKRAKGRALIIASITAYRPLVNFGVVPDFVIGIEKVGLAEYFTGTETDKEIRLMVGDISHESIFTDIEARGIFVVFSAFIGANKELNALFGNHFQPLSGGSVTTTALDIAAFLGASQIVLIGQDHAYGPGGSHVKGSVYGEQSIELSDDGNVQLGIDYEGVGEIDSGTVEHKVHWLDGVDGEKVMSRYDWVGFHQWIVDYVKIHKAEGGEIEMINATEAGAYIDEMVHMTLAEVIEKYVEPLEGTADVVENIISFAENKERHCDITALTTEFEKILFSFKTVQSLSGDSLKRIERIKKSYKKTLGLSQCGREIKALSNNENKLVPIFEEVSFLNEAASRVAYELQAYLKKEKLGNAEEQFMVDLDVTRSKNEAIVKITRRFVPLLLNVNRELQNIRKSGG